MEKSKYYYIVLSIIISIIIMYFIYSSQITDLKETVSSKDNYINELKSSAEEHKDTINYLKEENERLQLIIDDFQNQDDSSEPLENRVVTIAPQDNVIN